MARIALHTIFFFNLRCYHHHVYVCCVLGCALEFYTFFFGFYFRFFFSMSNKRKRHTRKKNKKMNISVFLCVCVFAQPLRLLFPNVRLVHVRLFMVMMHFFFNIHSFCVLSSVVCRIYKWHVKIARKKSFSLQCTRVVFLIFGIILGLFAILRRTQQDMIYVFEEKFLIWKLS